MQRGLLLFLILAIPTLLFIWSAASRKAELPDIISADTISVFIGDANIKAELAQTPSERVQGLSRRPSLPENTGMLFVFEKEDFHGIWMKDMLFPIDIIWIDENLRIVDIRENAEPESYPEVFRPKVKAKYVLEVNAGFSNEFAVEIGDSIGLE